MKRRSFLKQCMLAGGSLGGLSFAGCTKAQVINENMKPNITANRPNIILCMADDMGWGDVGFNGHPTTIKTPNLDEMAKQNLKFNRWYSAAPVCSPTRGSCITGRHPYRYGIVLANTEHMKKEEITLAEAVKTLGYRTGHFGKWHLGTLTKDVIDGKRGGRPENDEHYAPPWTNGFDQCLSTEKSVPTWDPMVDQSEITRFWTGPGKVETDNLEGDSSRVVMDRAIPFIQDTADKKTPFLAVIWFFTPHAKVVAGTKYLEMYSDLPEENQRHYNGCITAMDEQIGRLRKELKKSGIEKNTMLWFCSDNGPAGRNNAKSHAKRMYGSAGPFRGRKHDIYEGGVRVPALLQWPDIIKKPAVSNMPCSTSDYFPTIMEVLGFKIKGQPEPIDGISLLPHLKGTMTERPKPIGFQSRSKVALTDNRYKIFSKDKGTKFSMYDIIKDPGETTDISSQPEHQDRFNKMKQTVQAWRKSCANSRAGNDY